MEENKNTPVPAAEEQKTGEKNNKKLIVVIVMAVLLVTALLLGTQFGLFAGFGGLFNQIRIGWTVVLRLIIMVCIVFFVHFIVNEIAQVMFKKGGRLGTLSTILSSLVKYAAVLVGFCWGLSIIGVNISTIFASVGVMALIIGFGAESLVADVVTGVFMLFEDQFDVGDIIEVDGSRGTVESVGIRTVCLKDAGGNVKIINNSNLKNIINRSNLGSVAISDISVSYDDSLEEIEAKLPAILDEIEAHCCQAEEGKDPIFLSRPEYLGVESLDDSAVVLRFKVNVTEQNIFAGRRALNRELKVAFDKAGITIPFPQLDVHTR